MAVLAGGAAAAQAIGVAASPVLSRLYTPDAFGDFGVFLAIVSLAGIGVSLRYEAAIPLADGDTEALALLALAIVATVVVSLAAGVVVWLVIEVGGRESIVFALAPMLWLVPLVLLLMGLAQILSFWAIRTGAFGVNARASVAQAATQTAAQLALGVIGSGALGMSVGYLVGRVGGVGLQIPAVAPRHRAMLRQVAFRDVQAAALKHRRFPLISLWSALLNSASFHVPVLILAALFQATIVGWFLMTVRVLQLPLTLIGGSVGQVFYARASQAGGGELRSTTAAVYRSLVVLGTGPMVLLAVGGSEGFAIVFGEAWRGAGEYAQLLAPWLLLVFVASPLSTLVFVQSRQRGEFIFQAALVGARVGALLVGWQLGAASLAIGFFGAASALLWGVYLAWLLSIGGVEVRPSLKQLVRELAIGVSLALPVVAADLLAIQGLAWAVIAATVLGVMVLRSGRQLRMDAA